MVWPVWIVRLLASRSLRQALARVAAVWRRRAMWQFGRAKVSKALISGEAKAQFEQRLRTRFDLTQADRSDPRLYLLNILIDAGPNAIVNAVDDEHSNIDNFSAPGFRHLIEENHEAFQRLLIVLVSDALADAGNELLDRLTPGPRHDSELSLFPETASSVLLALMVESVIAELAD